MKRRLITGSGFTLLELLISLAMMAVMITACLTAVHLATASREAGNHKADMLQRLRVFHERLNSTLRSANLIFISADSKSLLPDEDKEKTGNSRILAFEGKPDSLKFVTFGDQLMGGNSSPWMHEVHFYLQKNEETDSLEILMNERHFSQEDFQKRAPQGLKMGQTLRIVQDVGYLKFRYYHEISEEVNYEDLSGDKTVKISGEWADSFITEPFDFKSSIPDNKNIANNAEPIHLPRAVEISVSLLKPTSPEEDDEPQMFELPSVIVPLQVGMVFERFAE